MSRKSMALIAVLGAAAALMPSAAHADEEAVVFEIVGLRSDDGQVLGALFGTSGDWPQQGHETASCSARIRGGRAYCILEGVRPGTYAFAFVHDENSNGVLDRDLIGIPREGFGFSRDARPSLAGAPSFASASFGHRGLVTALRVTARYGL